MIQPRGTRVLLKLDKSPRSFAGGELIIPDVPDLNRRRWYKSYPKRGKVLAVGPDASDLEVGDYVLCTTFNGVPVPERPFGPDLLLIKEEFILLILGKMPDAVQFGHVLEQWPGDREELNIVSDDLYEDAGV
jgi:co-chaperonin GroES (HSP10)